MGDIGRSLNVCADGAPTRHMAFWFPAADEKVQSGGTMADTGPTPPRGKAAKVIYAAGGRRAEGAVISLFALAVLASFLALQVRFGFTDSPPQTAPAVSATTGGAVADVAATAAAAAVDDLMEGDDDANTESEYDYESLDAADSRRRPDGGDFSPRGAGRARANVTDSPGARSPPVTARAHHLLPVVAGEAA